MKRTRILSLLGLGSFFLALETHGALTGINVPLPTGSPVYADFNMNSLTTTYHYDSGSGVGTFSIGNVGGQAQGEHYSSSAGSPGTGSNPYSNQQFQGFFSMTAFIKNVGGEWQVQSGSTLVIKGNLINSGNTSDILLSADLKAGANSFGWGTKADNEFDFLFNVISGGTDNQAILNDFFGVGAGLGGIKFHEGTGTTYNGSLTAPTWVSSGGGSVDVFVPEPAFYPLAAAGVAILGVSLAGRKSHRVNLAAA